MNVHNCKTEKCEGKKFGGLYLRCGSCENPSYIECIASIQSVANLLKLLNIAQPLNNNDQAATIAHANLKSILQKGSVFNYTCSDCNSYTNTLEVAMSKLTEKLNKYTNKNKNLNEELNTKTKQLAELTKTNAELHQKIVDLEQKNLSDPEMMDTEQIEMSSEEANKQVTNGELKNQLNALKASVTAKIGIEISKMSSIIIDSMMNADESRQKRKKPNEKTPVTNFVFNTPVSTTKGRRVTFVDLKSPEQSVTKQKSVYMIHISKFDSSQKTEQIEQHIMNNTTIINPDSFNIERLENNSYDKSKSKSVTFKLTTLKKQVYDEIMNKTLWEPKYKARDFVPSQHKNNTPQRRATNEYETPKSHLKSPKRFQKRDFHRDREYSSTKNTRQQWNRSKNIPPRFNSSYRSPRPSYDEGKRMHRFNHGGLGTSTIEPATYMPLWYPYQQPQANFLSVPIAQQQMQSHQQQQQQQAAAIN